MTARYLDLLFTPSVRAVQTASGSRDAYALREGAPTSPDHLTATEKEFIAARDSFYMATVSAGGWPYLQHRGGPPGFVRVLDARTLGIADFRGNRQYISVGNLADDGRAALFFIDYPRRTRLKLLARARAVDLARDAALAELLALPGYDAKVERGLVLDVEAFDWNCPQHIAPRFTAGDVRPVIDGLEARISELEAELSRLRETRALPT